MSRPRRRGFHLWLTGNLRFRIKSLALFLQSGWLREVKIKQRFQRIEIPFGLSQLNVDDLTGCLALYRVRSKAPMFRTASRDSASRLGSFCESRTC
jgi:hypothetical protein